MSGVYKGWYEESVSIDENLKKNEISENKAEKIIQNVI